jgi:ACS family D-galactonate transporter-like MFS transporter
VNISSAATPVAAAQDRAAIYRWDIILLLAASQTIAYMDRVNLSVAAPVLINQYHYTPATVGLLLSVFNWAFTLSLLFAGPFVDWVGARTGYVAGAVLLSAGAAACGTTVGFAPLALFRGLAGVGQAPMIPAGQRVIYETIPKRQRALAIATFFAGNKIGLAVGIPFASIVLHSLGLQWVFYLTGAMALLWMAWFLAAYRGNRSTPAATKNAVRWSTLLRYRTTWGIMLGQAGYLYTYYVFATWLPGYLVLQRKMSLLNSGFVGMLPFIVGVFVTIFGGWVSDRLVARKIRVTGVRKALAVSGLAAASLFTLLGAYTNGPWLAITFLTLAIAGFSFATGSIQAMAVDVAPPHVVSSLVSLQNFGGNVGGSCAPAITGMLISSASSFQLPLLVTAAVALVLGCGGFGLVVGSLDETLQPQASA